MLIAIPLRQLEILLSYDLLFLAILKGLAPVTSLDAKKTLETRLKFNNKLDFVARKQFASLSLEGHNGLYIICIINKRLAILCHGAMKQHV